MKGPGADGAEDVLAYVVCAVPHKDWPARGRGFGYIEVLGVHPRVRGLGLASALLARTMQTLRDEGLELAVRNVDAESLTDAGVLYERLGFTTVRRSVTLAKEF